MSRGCCDVVSDVVEVGSFLDESPSLQNPFTDLALEYEGNILHAETRLTEAFAKRKQSYVEMCKSKSKALDSCPKMKSIRDAENLVQVASQKLKALRRERDALLVLSRSQSSSLAQDASQLRRLLKRQLTVDVEPPSARISSGLLSRYPTSTFKSPGVKHSKVTQ